MLHDLNRTRWGVYCVSVRFHAHRHNKRTPYIRVLREPMKALTGMAVLGRKCSEAESKLSLDNAHSRRSSCWEGYH